jgi:hypothetical protein
MTNYDAVELEFVGGPRDGGTMAWIPMDDLHGHIVHNTGAWAYPPHKNCYRSVQPWAGQAKVKMLFAGHDLTQREYADLFCLENAKPPTT